MLNGVATHTGQDEIAYQRYALLGSIASIMAHEFNNLMTPVLTRSEAALQFDDVGMMRKALECTVAQTQRAIEIGRRLMELANCQPAHEQAVRVGDAVRSALAVAARPFEKDGIAFRSEIDEDAIVRGDPILLEQLLLTLLHGARQNLSRGGRIELEVRREPEGVLIAVSHSASRFSPEQIEQVLNPFLCRDVREQPIDCNNLGFGIVAVRAIAQLHGASVEAVADQTCGGCTYRVHWPNA